ncbi:hypothetical protein [Streptomyces kebangsaanensis]|nr:hypothetical protein [Streptomyces kebangsaanensis]
MVGRLRDWTEAGVWPRLHVTLSPSRIGDIARAALVLNGIWK